MVESVVHSCCLLCLLTVPRYSLGEMLTYNQIQNQKKVKNSYIKKNSFNQNLNLHQISTEYV